MWDENANAVDLLLKQWAARRVVPFVGAGLSQPLGYPGWAGFLKSVASPEAREDVVALLEP